MTCLVGWILFTDNLSLLHNEAWSGRLLNPSFSVGDSRGARQESEIPKLNF